MSCRASRPHVPCRRPCDCAGCRCQGVSWCRCRQGDASRALWREAFGTRTFNDPSSLVGDDTIFDLASLTKVLATTPIVIQQTERGSIGSMIPSTDISANGQARIGRTSLSGICCPTVLALPDGRRSFVSIAGGRSSNGPYVPCRSSTPLVLSRCIAIWDSCFSDSSSKMISRWRRGSTPCAPRWASSKTCNSIHRRCGSGELRPPRSMNGAGVLSSEKYDENAHALGALRAMRAVRDRRRGRPACASPAADSRGQNRCIPTRFARDVHHAPQRCPEQFTCARVGHDAPVVLMRWTDVAARVRRHTGFRARLFGSIPIAASTWSS